MSADKYPRIFSRQMAAIVYINIFSVEYYLARKTNVCHMNMKQNVQNYFIFLIHAVMTCEDEKIPKYLTFFKFSIFQ